ncbi:hypothetical protein Tco_1002342 [Tanacetum coccineum]|uniref:Uncharacterized protein n=1 Tax=Tanacetum coccineum TaxID=301880 RepID=A0ABQ5F6W4_9ASTR
MWLPSSLGQALSVQFFHRAGGTGLMDQLCKGTPSVSQVSSLPSCDQNGLLAVEPIAILDRKMVKKRNVVQFGLIQWANGTIEDAT